MTVGSERSVFNRHHQSLLEVQAPGNVYIIMSGEVSVVNHATLSSIDDEDGQPSSTSTQGKKPIKQRRIRSGFRRPKKLVFEVSRLGSSEFFGKKELDLPAILLKRGSTPGSMSIDCQTGINKAVSLCFVASSAVSVLVLKEEHLLSLPLNVQHRFEACVHEKAQLRKTRIEKRLRELMAGLGGYDTSDRATPQRSLSAEPAPPTSRQRSLSSDLHRETTTPRPHNAQIHLNVDSHSEDLTPIRVGIPQPNPWKLDPRFKKGNMPPRSYAEPLPGVQDFLDRHLGEEWPSMTNVHNSYSRMEQQSKSSTVSALPSFQSQHDRDTACEKMLGVPQSFNKIPDHGILEANLPELFVGHLGAHGSFSGVWAKQNLA